MKIIATKKLGIYIYDSSSIILLGKVSTAVGAVFGNSYSVDAAVGLK